jgi:hypothetical protein
MPRPIMGDTASLFMHYLLKEGDIGENFGKGEK